METGSESGGWLSEQRDRRQFAVGIREAVTLPLSTLLNTSFKSAFSCTLSVSLYSVFQYIRLSHKFNLFIIIARFALWSHGIMGIILSIQGKDILLFLSISKDLLHALVLIMLCVNNLVLLCFLVNSLCSVCSLLPNSLLNYQPFHISCLAGVIVAFHFNLFDTTRSS